MTDILPKPFTKDGLLQLLEKHLNHLKKHPNPTLDHIKDEDPHAPHISLHSPQKASQHTPASTWTTTSPQPSASSASGATMQPGTGLSPTTDINTSEHHYPLSASTIYAPSAAAQPGVNPNGLPFVPQQVPLPQHQVGQRRPLDMGEADLGPAAKRQQQHQQQAMYGTIQGMRSSR
jgi:osomolarity two-component system, response regulator SKN7